MTSLNLTRLCIQAALLLVLFSAAAGQETTGMSAAITDVRISFKLDPRLTKGMYMGDRWVSPHTYTAVGEGKEVAVEVRAEGFDSSGKQVVIKPRWVPTDPAMVTVMPDEGDQVRITVKSAGESRLKVTSPGFARVLYIRAKHRVDAITVEISQ